MRPVTRNNPQYYNNAGPFTIPDTYQGALNQNGCPVIPNSGQNGSHSYLLISVRTFMERMVEKKNNNPPLTLPQLKALNYLRDNFFTKGKNTSYKNAKRDLINNFGPFCSYCGVRINDYNLAVEHCLPESEFYDEMIMYHNFLLACPECNSSNKKANPTYLLGRNRAIANPPPLPPLNYPTYNYIKQYALNDYTWPTTVISAAWCNLQSAYHGFIEQYNHNFTSNVFQNIPFQLDWMIISENNSLTSIIDGRVRGIINLPPNPPPQPPPPAPQLPLNSSFGVTYIFNPLNGVANHMSQLVGLNKYDLANLHESDRRVLNRTIVWFHACTAFKQLDQIQALASPPVPAAVKAQLFQTAQQQMYATASESGFWEVWADLLIKKNGIGVGTLYDAFKTATTAANNTYFPGTDINFIP